MASNKVQAGDRVMLNAANGGSVAPATVERVSRGLATLRFENGETRQYRTRSLILVEKKQP